MSIAAFTDYDAFLFREGTHEALYEKLGAHPGEKDGVYGTMFRVWAPQARSVSVYTDSGSAGMHPIQAGIWEAFLPGVYEGTSYIYGVLGADGVWREKADPFAFSSELRPHHRSVVYDISRPAPLPEAFFPYDPERPMAVYEVHLPSWKQTCGTFRNYRELGGQLAEYVSYLGFTHVELIGIPEYPFDPSWGYQVTGYFAPTARCGSPEDFMAFVDTLHKSGIGIILDFVPAHTPKDNWGLTSFDGTCLYEYADPLRREMPGWGTCAFDHGRGEVRSFLLSSAFFWIRQYRMDGIRVDAVASMLTNSYCRSVFYRNPDGSDENREGIRFLRDFNRLIARDTHAFTIAEDSSILPGITAPVSGGGLGFSLKWSLGWMNDTLRYMQTDPMFRGSVHDKIARLADWSFLESFMLVFSHDEVVHLKRSMLMKLPGQLQDRLGCLRSLYTFLFTFPGKKLLFMGQEFAERHEWDESRELDWGLFLDPGSREVFHTVRGLLGLYKRLPVLHRDPPYDGRVFQWVNRYDGSRSTFSYIRKQPGTNAGAALCVLSFAPLHHTYYDAGVPEGGEWRCVFSTYDAVAGCGERRETLTAWPDPCDGLPCRLTFTLKPYESVIYEKV